MSIKAMDEVLSRMIRDRAFRDLLRRDPEQALTGYDLTPEERANLFRFKKGRSLKKVNRPPVGPATEAGHSFSLN